MEENFDDRLIRTQPDNAQNYPKGDSSPDIVLSEEHEEGQSKNSVRVSQINTT